jgi:hypothetical protein
MTSADHNGACNVSLQGTFDTLSVTELFGLLSTAGKTGALRLESAEHESGPTKAAVFVAAGLCCAVESDDEHGPSGSEAELARRLVDVGFSLARCHSGSFRFNDAESPPFDVVATTRFEPAVAEITTLLEQWHEIEATLPSLDARMRLAPVLKADEIVVTAAEWGLLAGLVGTPSVREMIARSALSMIEVCRMVADLVDRGAIEVGGPAELPEVRVEPGRRRREGPAHGSASPGTASPGTLHQIEVKQPYAPVSDAVTTAVDAIAAAEAADAIATAEADAVAAGLVSRMTKNRRALPDAFASGSDADAADGSEPDGVPSEALPASPATGAGSASVDAPQDRGALLRLFSALKE